MLQCKENWSNKGTSKKCKLENETRRHLPALKNASPDDGNGIFLAEKRHFSGVLGPQKAGKKRLNFVRRWE